MERGTLVLTRKPGESIDIGGVVTVTVQRSPAGGNNIRLIIDAPTSIKVMRSEVLERDAKDGL